MRRSIFSMLAIGLCLFDGNTVLAQNNAGAGTNNAGANMGTTPVVQPSMFPATNGAGSPAGPATNNAAVANGNINQGGGNSFGRAPGVTAAPNGPTANSSLFAPGNTRTMFSTGAGATFSTAANGAGNNNQTTTGIYNYSNPAMFNNSQYSNSQYTVGGNNNNIGQFSPSGNNQLYSANNSHYVGPSTNYSAQGPQGVNNSQGVNSASVAGPNNRAIAPALGGTPARKYADANSNIAGSFYAANPNNNSGSVTAFSNPGVGANMNYGTFSTGTTLSSIYGANSNTYAGVPLSVGNTPMPGLGNSAGISGGVSQGASAGQAQSSVGNSAGVGASAGAGSAAAGASGAAGGR